jgi:hypothetical protein
VHDPQGLGAARESERGLDYQRAAVEVDDASALEWEAGRGQGQ